MNPVILADNRFLDGTPEATDTAPGYDVLYIRDMKTFTSWKAASGGTKYLSVDCGEPGRADTLAIAAHNLGTVEAAVSVESSDNGTDWTERLAPFAPSDDRPVMRLFPPAEAAHWRQKIVTPTGSPQIAVAVLGVRIAFPLPPTAPFVPASVKIEAESSRSKTGQLLGTIVRFKPFTIEPEWADIPREWLEENIAPFWHGHASNLVPFFWAWDLGAYPDDVRFVKLQDEAAYDPSVSILSRYDRFRLPMEGIAQ
jgi:hypothetical protein